jgi:peptide/nickel transport system substrate-binding protein
MNRLQPLQRWPHPLVWLLSLSLGLPACIEPPEAESKRESTVVATPTATPPEVDRGPAADAPRLRSDLLDPRIEDAPTGRYGGSLTFGAYEDPKTFNPTLVTDAVSARFVTYFFESLIEEDGITFEVEPTLARSFEVLPDGKSYLFKLRRGLRWHDGQPLTADDVVFTFNQVLPNPDIPWELRDVSKIDGKLPVAVKLASDLVRIELTKPFAPFLRSVAASTPIMPRHIFGPWLAKGSDGKPIANSKWGVDKNAKEIVGSGPWQLEQYVPGERIVLKRNPLYYRVNRHRQPLPYADRMVVPFLKSLETAMLKFKAGETDAQWIPGKDYGYMKPFDKDGNFTIHNLGPDFRTTYLMFNLNPGRGKDGKPLVDPIKLRWFADRRFRQAVSHAIDRKAIIKNVFRGLATMQDSPIFQKSPYFDPTVATYPFDRNKALALLKESGFQFDGKVLKDADGHPVTFTMLRDVGFKDGELRANMIADDLRKIGIEVKFQSVTFNVKLARTHESKDWECVGGDWTAGIEPHGVANLWQSSGQSHLFNLNPGPVSRPVYDWERRIDGLFLKGAATVDEAKRKAIYNEFQQIVANEQLLIFLPVFYYVSAIRNTVGNARPSAFSSLGASWNSWELYKR